MVTQTAPKEKNVMYYIHCVVGLLFMFGFGMLEPIKPITPVGMQVLGIFLSMIYLWSFVGLLWPSLLGIAALGLSGYGNFPTVLAKSFGDPVPVLVFFAMVLFGAIQHYGTTKYISRWFLTRKIINGRPVVFSFVFIYTTYVLAALSANVLPAILFMWSVLYGVLEDVGYKKGDKYTTVMVIGTLFGAISGQAAKPFTGSALAIVGAFEKTAKTPMDYLPYMLYGFIMSSLAILVYSALIKFVFKPDMSKITDISTERFEAEKLPPMDLRQKIMFGCLFGYLGLVLVPSILPKTIGFVGFLNKLGPLGLVMVIVIGLCLFKINGKPIIEFKEIAGRYLIWDVYFLIAMAMVVSDALTANSTGIKPFLTGVVNPLLGGCSATTFAILLAIFPMLITQGANNAVMGILFMPIVYPFALQNGSNPMAIATLMTFALHVAILTPAASPYAAVLYGNKDWVETGEVLKYSTVILICMAILYVVIGVPLLKVVF